MICDSDFFLIFLTKWWEKFENLKFIYENQAYNKSNQKNVSGKQQLLQWE